MKTCTKCGVSQEATRFNTREKGHLRATCKTCDNTYKRERYASSPEHHRERSRAYAKTSRGKDTTKNRHLKRMYDITLEEYRSMVEVQNNCCAICGYHTTKEYGGLVVDHNHETGKVRGLLCKNCNTGIGLLQEETIVLTNAIKYLIKHNEE